MSQTVKFEIVSIDRRVDDPFAPTGVVLNPPKPVTGVAVRSNAVLSTGSNRLEVAERALASIAVEQGANAAAGTAFRGAIATFGSFGQQGPIPVNLLQAALQQVDQDLVKEGLLDKVGGQVSQAAKRALGLKKPWRCRHRVCLSRGAWTTVTSASRN